MTRARDRAPPRRCAGQAATETLVVAAAVVGALCLPWAAGESPAALLLGAIVGVAHAFQAWLFLI
ncbi:MAG: hypothetical protein MUF07_03145 [Steroidobacteraceae bacterium]|jgi:hypothetical protein|nr:hypothetical protein [Steroidobacteraceae bacterium]